MKCPHCCEEFTLWKYLKNEISFFIALKAPRWLGRRVEQYKEDSRFEKLQKLYNSGANLTEREHFVCYNRVQGRSREEIARSMNVTWERVRQIEDKALRKLERALNKKHTNDVIFNPS